MNMLAFEKKAYYQGIIIGSVTTAMVMISIFFALK